jgi:hypothetical protein
MVVSHPEAVAIVESLTSDVLRANMVSDSTAPEYDTPTVQSTNAKKYVSVFAHSTDACEVVPEPP